MRILIYVVAFEAENHIIQTLQRIPDKWLRTIDYEILISDDASKDNTKSLCYEYQKNHSHLNISIQSNPVNLGYGGNQKLGYKYAREGGFDVVVLIHGDGQYAPEYLGQMTTPITEERADVVLGSRMINKLKALKGNMPLYKWLGNQVLSTIQNTLLRTSLSEFHTGYRAFSVESLAMIPLEENSDYFDFDTEIIIQLIDRGAKFEEVSIPTFYGDEISYVNGIKYAYLILSTTIKSRLCRLGWVRDARFPQNAKKLV